MQKKYPDIVFIGGLDTQFVVDVPGVTEEELRKEVRRCIDTYGPQGNYVFSPASVAMMDLNSYSPGGKMWILSDESRKYVHKK